MISEETREDFMRSIYDMFSGEETNDKANQIIDIFDIITENCVDLPCKVGDTVYFVYSNENGYLFEEAVVTEVSTERIWISDRRYYFNYDDIGKTVFLTPEEAEKALEERGSNERIHRA